MANWLDEQLRSLLGMTPNMADPYRNAEGRIDASAIKAAVPSAVAEDVDMATTIGNLRMQQLESIRPKAETGWNTLGRALHAASIPVSFAQGNQAYGLWAANNDPSVAKRAREQQYEDAANKSRLGIMDETLTGVGNSGLEYLKSKRVKRDAAIEKAANMIAVAGIRGGPGAKASALKDAATYLRSLGLTAEADGFDAQAAKSEGAPAAPGGSAPVPGISVTPAQPGADPAVAPALPPAAAASTYVSPKREIAARLMAVDKESGEAMLKEAEAEEEPYREGAKEMAKQSAQARVKIAAEQPAAKRMLDTTNETLGSIDREIDNLLMQDESGKATLTPGADSNVGGWYDTYMPNQPGTAASNAWASIEKLKSNIGVQVLNAMREASPTGGAVGNVTEKEWPILQNQLASLDPRMGEEALAENLLEIKRRVARMRDIAAGAYESNYGSPEGRVSADAAGARTSEQTQAPPEAPKEAERVSVAKSAAQTAMSAPEGEPLSAEILGGLKDHIPNYDPSLIYTRKGSRIVPLRQRKVTPTRGGLIYER